MNDDAITYLEEKETNEESNIKPIKNITKSPEVNNEFINGLPDWDLEPPYELIKRSKL